MRASGQSAGEDEEDCGYAIGSAATIAVGNGSLHDDTQEGTAEETTGRVSVIRAIGDELMGVGAPIGRCGQSIDGRTRNTYPPTMPLVRSMASGVDRNFAKKVGCAKVPVRILAAYP